ncbi:MAG: DUF6491 family protein [Pseudomonadota bacterium]
MRTPMSLAVAASISALSISSLGAVEHHEAEEKVDPRLGERVDRICFQRNINSWRSVKDEDDVVLLERSVNNWYRVELNGGCDERLFRFATAIGIDSRPGGGCVTRGDTIIVEDGPGFNRRCIITRIYEWNEDAIEDESAAEGEDG